MAGHSGGPDGIRLAIIDCIGDCALDAADSACLESIAHGGSGRLPLSVATLLMLLVISCGLTGDSG